MSNQRSSPAIRVLDCPRGSEYDEETFLYFLAIEQARADRLNHPLPLLLATLEPMPGQPIPFPRAGASRLFAGLRSSLRDTDVMGWYRQDHVVGAVLSAPKHMPDAATTTASLEQRIARGLRSRLPAHLASSLRVRVVQQGLRGLDSLTGDIA